MADLDQNPDSANASPEEQVKRRRRKRRLLWVVAAVVVLLALLITPPLIQVNRLRRRIAASMSASLGRPVQIDNVTLNVLPMPGFTLENLVVSEDPAFGFEPVIRAQSVRVTLRVSSLWRRHVEIATVRFDDPSVNLVRRADGRWNLESILLHAAQEDTAPTAQSKPGPAPRFPYIEATGARLNVKMGDEKMPFALTEADFALWLPSPQQWRVRIEAKPARTDTPIANSSSDTGILAVEATLEKAARLQDVPIEMTASWRRAPLGEATRVLTGSDAGWRGGTEATAVVHGTLGDAIVTGNLKLTNVRRADFIPSTMLNLEMDCSGHLAVNIAVAREPSCRLPVVNSAGDEESHGLLVATADLLDLTGLRTSGLRFGMTDVPDAWLLSWVRLFSQRIPESFSPRGRVAGSVVHTAGQDDAAHGWQGEFHDVVKLKSADGAGEKSRVDSRTFSLVVGPSGLTLAPANIAPADKTPLMLSGEITNQAYTMQVAGTATPQEIASTRSLVPPLSDGMAQVLPAATATSAAPIRLDVTCVRPWGGEQTCSAVHAPEAVKKPQGRRRR